MSIKKLNYCFIFALFSLQAQAFQLDTDLTLSYDNNVSVAESSRDIFSDNALQLSVIGSQSFRINPNSSLSFKGKLERNEFAQFNDLVIRRWQLVRHIVFSLLSVFISHGLL